MTDCRRVLPMWGLVALACGGPGVTESAPSNLVGSYELTAVGTKRLPVALPLDGPPRVLLVADTLWLRADSSYEEHMMREVIGPAPLVLSGRFSVTGATVILTQTGGAPVTGRVRDSTLTVGEVSASALLYVKRCDGATC